jgi:hypothetical protein
MPRKRSNSGVLQSAKQGGRDVLKFYDNVASAVGSMTGVPRRIAGSLVGERKNAMRKMIKVKGHARIRKGGNPRNPEEQAAAMYESFHGKPAEGVTIIKEEFHEHEWLAPLGVLVNFKVATLSGFDLTVGTSDEDAEGQDFDETAATPETIFVAANETGTQLYFKGGDQSFPLDRCKMGENSDWYRDDMIVGILYEITYRTKKKFDKFQLTDYYHALGEETGDQPMLRYDPLSPHLYVSGGKYKIKMPLVGMSPGIEN